MYSSASAFMPGAAPAPSEQAAAAEVVGGAYFGPGAEYNMAGPFPPTAWSHEGFAGDSAASGAGPNSMPASQMIWVQQQIIMEQMQRIEMLQQSLEQGEAFPQGEVVHPVRQSRRGHGERHQRQRRPRPPKFVRDMRKKMRDAEAIVGRDGDGLPCRSDAESGHDQSDVGALYRSDAETWLDRQEHTAPQAGSYEIPCAESEVDERVRGVAARVRRLKPDKERKVADANFVKRSLTREKVEEQRPLTLDREPVILVLVDELASLKKAVETMQGHILTLDARVEQNREDLQGQIWQLREATGAHFAKELGALESAVRRTM